MHNYRVHRDSWMIHLIPVLNHTLLEIFGRLPRDTQEVYLLVKECLLREMNITSETYRRRFEALTRDGWGPVVAQATTLVDNWWQGCRTNDDRRDLVALEKVFTLMPAIGWWNN